MTDRVYCERRDPTHVLMISVPLHVDGDYDRNPLEEALRVIMPLTRLATTGAVCDDITVSVHEIATWPVTDCGTSNYYERPVTLESDEL